MEFYIKKNSTLPKLQVEVINESRNGYNQLDPNISASTVTFSMSHVENDIFKIANSPATIKVMDDRSGYILSYQFTKKNTNRNGRYKGVFTIINERGTYEIPINEDLFIQVSDSFVDTNMCCRRNNVRISPTPSRTPTPTPSVTPTTSVSPTPTPTVTKTATPSVSITPSVSVSPSITPSVSISSSVTPSVSITPSITTSVTSTPSVTITSTPTITVTPSTTVSQTPGASVSITPTPSITQTVSPTISVSVSPTVSPSISVTPTSSVTPTVTPTITPTNSVSSTPTPTISISNTPGASTSVTPTNTPSVSITNSISVTPSVTPSMTVSVTTTPTISVTTSTTPTISVTTSTTPTLSPTNSVTPSITPTISISNTPNSSLSVTPTSTVTPTITSSVTATPTVSTTPDVSVTVSITPTSTPTITPSVTSTVTPSVSPSVTTSVTPTLTPSISSSITPSVTPTITPSSTVSTTPDVSVTTSVTPTLTPSSSTPCCDTWTLYGGDGTCINPAEFIVTDCDGNISTVVVNQLDTVVVCARYVEDNNAPICNASATPSGTCVCPSPTPTTTPSVTPSITPTVTPTVTVSTSQPCCEDYEFYAADVGPTGVTVNYVTCDGTPVTVVYPQYYSITIHCVRKDSITTNDSDETNWYPISPCICVSPTPTPTMTPSNTPTLTPSASVNAVTTMCLNYNWKGVGTPTISNLGEVRSNGNGTSSTVTQFRFTPNSCVPYDNSVYFAQFAQTSIGKKLTVYFGNQTASYTITSIYRSPAFYGNWIVNVTHDVGAVSTSSFTCHAWHQFCFEYVAGQGALLQESLFDIEQEDGGRILLEPIPPVPSESPTPTPTRTPSVTVSTSAPQRNLLVDNLGNYIVTDDTDFLVMSTGPVPSPTPTTTTTITSTPSVTSSITPTVTPTFTTSNTPTPSVTSSVTPTVTPTITSSNTPTVTPSTTPPTFVTSGLIMDWDLQNSSSYNGTGSIITDLQGNSDGTFVGGVYTSGSTNYLELASGNGDYILSNTSLNSVLSPPNTGTEISHFIWVYPTGDGIIVDELGSNSLSPVWHDSQIELVGGQLTFRLWNLSSPYVVSNTPINMNQWNYIGITYNGTTMDAYLNGQNVGSATFARLSPGNNSAGLHYGISVDDITNMGNGTGASMRFGAFHVYNVGLSPTQVLYNYNSTLPSYLPPTPTPSVTQSITPTPTITPTPSSSVSSSSVWQLRRIDNFNDCSIDTTVYRAINTLGAVSSNYILGTDGFCYLVVNESPGDVTVTMGAGPYIECSSCLT